MRTILQGFNDSLFADVVAKIRAAGIETPFVLTSKPSLYANDARFLGIECVDEVVLIKRMAQEITETDIANTSLDRPLLEKFVQTELSVLSLSDRNTYFPKGTKFRKRVFYRLLRYWINQLDRIQPDTVVFANTPHSVETIVLYDVARARGIPVYIVERTNIDDRVLIKQGFDESTPVPPDFLPNVSLEKMMADVCALYVTDPFGKSRWEKKSIATNQAALGTSDKIGLRSRIHHRFGRVTSLVASPFEQRRNASGMFFGGTENEFLLRLVRWWNGGRQRKLQDFYRSLATAVDFEQKFVYFPLHFQPERTTSPLGGIFEDQILAIRMLAQALPVDWLLYVKEHPRQFDSGSYYSLQQKNYRDQNDYRSIQALKNVRIIHIEESGDKLLDRAEMVATVTGTTGWQALIAGKSVICFGYSSYLDCPSAYLARSVAECRKIIEAAQTKNRDAVKRDLLRYLLFIESSTIRASHAGSAAVGSSITPDQMSDNLANGISARLRANGVHV